MAAADDDAGYKFGDITRGVLRGLGNAVGMGDAATEDESSLEYIPRLSERTSGLKGLRYAAKSYRTVKYYVIEDSVLAAVFRSAQFLVLVYATYNILVLKSYYKKYPVGGSANVYASMGQSSAMLKVNQSDASQGYCCHHGCTVDAVGQDYDCFGGHDMKNNRCRDYEFGEVVQKRTDAVFVLTYATNTVIQSGAATTTENYFVPGAENIVVAAITRVQVHGPLGNTNLFRHSVDSVDCTLGGPGACERFHRRRIFSGTFSENGRNSIQLDMCDESNAAAPAWCTAGSVAMPVHGWIAIAEAVEQIKIEDRKLDMLYRLGGSGLVLSSRNVAGQEECTVDLKPEHAPYYRMTGYAVDVDVRVTNFHSGLFDTDHDIYTDYYIHRSPLKGWSSYLPGAAFRHDWPTSSEWVRVDPYNYGVLISFSFSGYYGRFDWKTFITALVGFAVMLRVAPLATDLVMANFLGDRSDIYKDQKNSLADKHALEKEKAERAKEEQVHIKKLFRHFDTDGSGVINREEAHQILVLLGINPNDEAKLSKLVQRIDVNGDDDIDENEFTAWWISEMEENWSSYKKMARKRREHASSLHSAVKRTRGFSLA